MTSELVPDDDLMVMLTCMADPAMVSEIEQALLDAPQRDLGTTHLVHGGMYARTIFIPADTFLTGALTEADNVCIVVGDITVTTDTGPRRLTGFNVLPARKGAKRMGRTHADTWWTAIFRTDQTDIAAIERELTTEADMLQTNRPGIEYEPMNLKEIAP